MSIQKQNQFDVNANILPNNIPSIDSQQIIQQNQYKSVNHIPFSIPSSPTCAFNLPLIQNVKHYSLDERNEQQHRIQLSSIDDKEEQKDGCHNNVELNDEYNFKENVFYKQLYEKVQIVSNQSELDSQYLFSSNSSSKDRSINKILTDESINNGILLNKKGKARNLIKQTKSSSKMIDQIRLCNKKQKNNNADLLYIPVKISMSKQRKSAALNKFQQTDHIIASNSFINQSSPQTFCNPINSTSQAFPNYLIEGFHNPLNQHEYQPNTQKQPQVYQQNQLQQQHHNPQQQQQIFHAQEAMNQPNNSDFEKQQLHECLLVKQNELKQSQEQINNISQTQLAQIQSQLIPSDEQSEIQNIITSVPVKKTEGYDNFEEIDLNNSQQNQIDDKNSVKQNTQIDKHKDLIHLNSTNPLNTLGLNVTSQMNLSHIQGQQQNNDLQFGQLQMQMQQREILQNANLFSISNSFQLMDGPILEENNNHYTHPNTRLLQVIQERQQVANGHGGIIPFSFPSNFNQILSQNSQLFYHPKPLSQSQQNPQFQEDESNQSQIANQSQRGHFLSTNWSSQDHNNNSDQNNYPLYIHQRQFPPTSYQNQLQYQMQMQIQFLQQQQQQQLHQQQQFMSSQQQFQISQNNRGLNKFNPMPFDVKNKYYTYRDNQLIETYDENRPFMKLTAMKTNQDNANYNQVYIVTPDGMVNSKKNTETDEIIIGRQEITKSQEATFNSQTQQSIEIRPNDIVLPPQDRSISRIHCKIIYKNGFRINKKICESFLRFLHGVKQNSFFANKNVCIPDVVLRLIWQFVRPKHAFYIVDIASAQGTFIKIRYDKSQIVEKGQVFLVGAETQFHILEVNHNQISDNYIQNLNEPSNHMRQQDFIDFLLREKKNNTQIHGLSDEDQQKLDALFNTPDIESQNNSTQMIEQNKNYSPYVKLKVNSSLISYHIFVYNSQTIDQGFKIGRSQECAIQININTISRKQSRFFYSKGNWQLKDGDMNRESANGTWMSLNDFREKNELRNESDLKEIVDGSEIKISDSILKVEIYNNEFKKEKPKHHWNSYQMEIEGCNDTEENKDDLDVTG